MSSSCDASIVSSAEFIENCFPTGWCVGSKGMQEDNLVHTFSCATRPENHSIGKSDNASSQCTCAIPVLFVRSPVSMFCPICVYSPIRVRDIPYAYGTILCPVRVWASHMSTMHDYVHISCTYSSILHTS